MRTAILGAFCLLLLPSAAMADDWVNAYTRRDGTYVGGYWRTERNGNPYDNYSTRGNVNPYTGVPGYKDPYSSGEETRPWAPRNFGQAPEQSRGW